MIARHLRLRSPREFERVRSEGRSWSNRLLVMVARPNELGANRYGFAAGRGIGNAVARNRAKRLMREAARQRHPDIAPGHDIIFIARNRAGPDTRQDEIREAMDELLACAGLLRTRPSTVSSWKSQRDH